MVLYDETFDAGEFVILSWHDNDIQIIADDFLSQKVTSGVTLVNVKSLRVYRSTAFL
jgi:hypothetical protein